MFQAGFREVVYALSDALDLVGVDEVAHGKRVGIMAAQCARAAGWPDEEVRLVFDAGLLHDIGVSRTTLHRKLVEEFDWAGSEVHAIDGYGILHDFRPLAHLALPIRYHHARWEQLVAEGVDETVRRRANLLFLADRVDALAMRRGSVVNALLQRGSLQAEIESRRDTYFDPALVEAFLRASSHEAFWLSLETDAIYSYLGEMLASSRPLAATHAEMLQLGRIFGRIVDAKSPFTAEHSSGVANLARRLGERMGMDEARCNELEMAGLLHDIGKLRVPDHILDKPGPLDDDERMVMHTHSFGTMQILRKIRGFESIASWSADHHEAPGGRGYPYGLDGAALPVEARILRVADIFQAMIQDRPYRAGLTPREAAEFMRALVAGGGVDADITAVLLQDVEEMVKVARSGTPVSG